MKQDLKKKKLQTILRPLILSGAVWFAALLFWAPAFSSTDIPPSAPLGNLLAPAAAKTPQARQTVGATEVSTSAFADKIIECMS